MTKEKTDDGFGIVIAAVSVMVGCALGYCYGAMNPGYSETTVVSTDADAGLIDLGEPAKDTDVHVGNSEFTFHCREEYLSEEPGWWLSETAAYIEFSREVQGVAATVTERFEFPQSQCEFTQVSERVWEVRPRHHTETIVRDGDDDDVAGDLFIQSDDAVVWDESRHPLVRIVKRNGRWLLYSTPNVTVVLE